MGAPQPCHAASCLLLPLAPAPAVLIASLPLNPCLHRATYSKNFRFGYQLQGQNADMVFTSVVGAGAARAGAARAATSCSSAPDAGRPRAWKLFHAHLLPAGIQPLMRMRAHCCACDADAAATAVPPPLLHPLLPMCGRPCE